MLILNNLIDCLMENNEEELNEARISIMKRGLNSKRSALAGATAMQIARKKNPAMYRMNCTF